ncbi:DUF397 domain-containing protein [Nocardia anaemiae]|uniref:DUF397 domain-containing protein n=1 Tax=Nocardia anaemiae TaxID=263910 RepID=UPI001470FF24
MKSFKSSPSGARSNCLEVTFLPNNLVGIRDSKNPPAPHWCSLTTRWRCHERTGHQLFTVASMWSRANRHGQTSAGQPT